MEILRVINFEVLVARNILLHFSSTGNQRVLLCPKGRLLIIQMSKELFFFFYTFYPVKLQSIQLRLSTSKKGEKHIKSGC